MSVDRAIRGEDLTEQEHTFLGALIQGRDVGDATNDAGWKNRAYGYEVLKRPRVHKALYNYRVRLIQGHGAQLALRTMIELLDPKVPAGTRYKAADRLLQLAGHVVPRVPSAGEKPLFEMDEAELRGVITRIKAEIDAPPAPMGLPQLEAPDLEPDREAPISA